MDELQALKNKVEELEKKYNDFSDYSTIPLEVQRALENRLSGISLSSSSHSGESQAVDEGGASTYNVMTTADGFVQTKINGATVYIPYFT